MDLLTGELGVLKVSRLLLGLLGWADPFSLWLITESQSHFFGELFSLPAWRAELRLPSVCSLNTACLSFVEELWELSELLLLLTSGHNSDTPSFSSPTPEASPVSSRRLARRSEQEPWRTGLSTLRHGEALRAAGKWPRLIHCWMDEGILGLRSLATGADVFDGRGRSAPVGAQAAGWGEARDADLSDMGLLAGVTATGLKGPEKTVKTTTWCNKI